MNDQTRKVLRRVCAQYYTGIRKPFGIDGVIYQITSRSDTMTPGDTEYLMFNDIDIHHVTWQSVATPITPESIIEAINLYAVESIMES